MIQNIRHRGLRRLLERNDASRVNQNHVRRLRLILTVLDAAKTIEEVNFPGSQLHRLHGKLQGFWSVRVSGNWRIIFHFEEGEVYDVDYVDYH